MADKNYIGKRVYTPVFRAAFAHVFEPKSFITGGDKKYSTVMLFPKDTDLSEMKQAGKEIALSFFNGVIPKKFTSPFKDGDEPNDEGNIHDGFPGCIAVTASSKSKPGVVDESVKPIIDRAEFKSGDYAIATVTAAAYDYLGKKGVKFYLNNLQKVKTGEPFGAAVDPTKEFQAINRADEDTEGMFGEQAAQPEDKDEFL